MKTLILKDIVQNSSSNNQGAVLFDYLNNLLNYKVSSYLDNGNEQMDLYNNINSPAFSNLFRHELTHVLGMGTAWNDVTQWKNISNGIYNQGVYKYYMGQNALQFYN